MARHLGEDDFAATCRDLFARGSRWMDAHLFNGEYYEHEIRPISDPAAIAPGLRHESMGAQDLANPDLQLGAGCLVDQLVGQYTAHVCGLGYLLDPETSGRRSTACSATTSGKAFGRISTTCGRSRSGRVGAAHGLYRRAPPAPARSPTTTR
jgi:hypothetical protein